MIECGHARGDSARFFRATIEFAESLPGYQSRNPNGALKSKMQKWQEFFSDERSEWQRQECSGASHINHSFASNPMLPRSGSHGRPSDHVAAANAACAAALEHTNVAISFTPRPSSSRLKVSDMDC